MKTIEEMRVSAQDSGSRARASVRKQEKWLGGDVFPAVIRQSTALALCTSPCLWFVHMPRLLAVGEGCARVLCVRVCARAPSFRGVEAQGGNRQILLAGLTHGNTVNNAKH